MNQKRPFWATSGATNAHSGSRCKGTARPDSDIDLAITVDGSDQGNVFGNYYALSAKWQDETTELLGTKAHVGLFNDEPPSYVIDGCKECRCRAADQYRSVEVGLVAAGRSL